VNEEIEYEGRRFGSGASEREHLVAWLRERGVEQVVMESTAQYWKRYGGSGSRTSASCTWPRPTPTRRRRAQETTSAMPGGWPAPAGGELILSFVPDAEQRAWRTMTRSKLQLVRDRVRLQNQLEALLEEMRIKLSSVLSDLLGLSGRRILEALAGGQTDPVKLAELGDDRLKCSQEELIDALRGRAEPMHLQILKLYLERLKLLDRQIEALQHMAAQALHRHEQVVIRLAETPGLGVDSAQQIIAEVGIEARAFPSRRNSPPGRAPSREAKKARRPIIARDPPKGINFCGDPHPGSAGSHQEEGLPLPERVPKTAAQTGV